MHIQFVNTKEWGIKTKSFISLISKLKRMLPKVQGELNVVFTNDETIHSLNKAYRHIDKSTDVLSFSYINAPDFKISRMIGEIYISIPTAKMQAPVYGNTLENELKKLIAHGVFHVFGYDHETDEDYRVMSEMESRVL